VGLDVLTPRGRQTVADLQRGVSLWESANPGWRYAATPDTTAAAIDGLLVDPGGTTRAIVEAKCRYDVTVEQFVSQYKNEWLITMAKLTTACDAARLLCVPLVGFLYLVKSDVLLSQRIADDEGTFVARFWCAPTKTRKTCNGGTACRSNAYINMEGSKRYER
jgi:hypothetical protein